MWNLVLCKTHNGTKHKNINIPYLLLYVFGVWLGYVWQLQLVFIVLILFTHLLLLLINGFSFYFYPLLNTRDNILHWITTTAIAYYDYALALFCSFFTFLLSFMLLGIHTNTNYINNKQKIDKLIIKIVMIFSNARE